MLRHPIYLACCLFAVGYLAIADARGWSLLRSFSTALMPRGMHSGAHSFNHK